MAPYNVRLWYQHILEIGVPNFAELDGRADFLGPFIWSRVCGLMRFRDGSDKERIVEHQFLYKSWKKCDGDPGND
jgi:hypothetical protein